jgi:hypothetical protein
VPVRIVNFKGVDLNRFRFDYDLTFAVLMMDAEGHTYARYGSQDHRHSAERMSIPGLKKAMQDVLGLHAGRKPEPEAAASKPFLVEDYAAFRRMKAAGEACYHCHYANNARFAQLRLDGKFTKEALFQHPLPENIGLELDVDANNVVKRVIPGSPAETGGVRAGDVVSRAESTPVITPADLQFALDSVGDPGSVTLRLRRAGREIPAVTLQLPKGWRRADISWRPSAGGIPPTVGFWAKPLTDAEKRQRGIPPERLGLLVNFMFPGPQWARTRGELRSGDVLVGINGEMLPSMNTRQFHSYFRLRFNVGDTVTLNVLRGGQPVEVRVPCLDVGEE